MKRSLLLIVVLVVGCAVVAVAVAQTPAVAAPASVTCTVAAATAPTDADRAFSSGNYEQAEQLFSASLGGTDAGAAYAGLIRSELEEGKIVDALANANKAVAAMPSSALSHTLLGEALARDGQIAEASGEFKRAVTIDRCFARAHFGAGNLLRMASMRASAQREFNLAHQLAPRDGEIAVAWLEGLAADSRAGAIRKYLDQPASETEGPAIASRRHSLEVNATMLEAGRTCHVDLPSEKVALDLKPLMVNGVPVRDWGLDARINNHGTLLELDTTVSGVVLSRSLAGKTAVMPVVKGDEANEAGYMAYADSIKIGKATLLGCLVRVVNDKALAGGNSLISPEVFAESNININFATRLLTLSPLPANPAAKSGATATDAPADRYVSPDMQTWSRVYIADGRILMPTAINKSKPYLFMLDTAAPVTIISPPVAQRVLSVSPDATVALRGVSADIVKVYEKSEGSSIDVADIYDGSGKLLKVWKPFKAPIFDFARVNRLDSQTYSFDLSPVSRSAHVEIAGLIGFSVLQDLFVSIDYRDGLVNLVFDSNYLYRVRNGTVSDAERNQ